MKRLSAGIVGGSGYVGLELIRLLATHPAFTLTTVTSREHVGQPVAAIHLSLDGIVELRFSEFSAALAELDVVFLAVPHGESMRLARLIREANPTLPIIDLGADFRLPAATFEQIYGEPHAAPELLNGACYGTPELTPAAVGATKLLANPGCFAHCITLGLAPLARAGAIAAPVRITALTGSSGSGVKPTSKTHHPERNDSLSAYQVLTHRHTPEIERALSAVSPISIELVPLSGPFSRGIFATSFITLRDSGLRVHDLYTAFAAEHHFIRLREETPRLIDVRGSNFCDLAVHQRGAEVVVLSAIDNLGKGAAGNAVQCANLMFGLPAGTGLTILPLVP